MKTIKLILAICLLSTSFTNAIAQCNPSFTNQVIGYTLNCSATQINATTAHIWYLGDGSIKYGTTMNHTYTNAGTYIVKHVIRNSSGVCYVSAQLSINIIDSTCNWQATFTHNTIAPKTKAFFGLPNGATKKYAWNFGDNTSSTLQNPTHTYSNVGNYNVRLIVRDTLNNCRDTVLQTVNIMDSNTCNLQAQFTSQNYGPRTKYFSGYVNYSAGYNNKKYTWYFGDGTSSNQQYVIHTYSSSGNYAVKLTVKDSITNCIDSITQVQTVVDCDYYVYLFSQILNNKKVNFSGYGNNGGVNNTNNSLYQWNFGDGSTSTSNQQNILHTYSSFGTYNVRLIARDTINNCRDTVYQTINLNDSNSCSWNAAITSTVSNTNNKQYIFHATPNGSGYYYYWNFGDGGNVSGTNANPTHTYANGGTYAVGVSIFANNNQCHDTTFTIINITPTIADSCTADFTHSVPTQGNIQLTALSNQNITAQVWNIYHNGALVTSNLINPLIAFTDTGVYEIQLTITTSTGCQKTKWKNITLSSLNGRMNNNVAKLFPNPAAKVLNYSIFCTSKEEINWRVLGVDGSIKSSGIFKAIIGENKYLLPIQNLTTGSYIFEYRTSEEKKSILFQKM